MGVIKYNYNRKLFKNIDTEEKAYILGFIAADGSLSPSTVSIFVNKKDVDIIEKIKNYICPFFPIKPKDDLMGISINSKEIVKDICNHLKILPKKKSGIISFPNINNNLKIHFIRGVFDGDGHIRTTDGRDHPECGISNYSQKLLGGIVDNINIKPIFEKNRISFSGINALDFLSQLYDNASIYLNRKYWLYMDWATYLPGLPGIGNSKGFIEFRVVKTHPYAILPFKKRASDCGYDLSFIRRIKEDGDIHWYGTGIKIKPAYGWYVDIVPRSSISKWGYMLSNSIGVIDRGYSGEILSPMIKIDKSKPNPELPVRMIQAIPRRVVHVKIVEVEEFDETERGEGGFGSTG
jgi:dUTP pyrophosphatase